MNRFMLGVLLAGALLLTAASGALAEATTATSVVAVPLDGRVVDNPCAGESLLLTGSLQLLVHTTGDASGGFHVVRQTSYHGVGGVGLTSGRQYRATGAEQASFTIRGPFPFVATTAVNIHLVGQGPGDNYLLHGLLHLTFNANGELTATAFDAGYECR